MKRLLFPLFGLLSLLIVENAAAQTFSPVPFNFTFGSPANASQVMANFQSIVNNGNAVANLVNSQIAAVTPPVSGTYMYFNLGSCPAGWTISGATFNTAFVRGVDAGRGKDTTGTMIGGSEATTLQDHAHVTTNAALTVNNNTAFTSGPHNQLVIPGTGTGSVTDGATGNVSGATAGTEARPKNVSLLLCSKN